MREAIEITWRSSKLVRTRKQEDTQNTISTPSNQFSLKTEAIKAQIYLKCSNREGKNTLIERYISRVQNLLGVTG